MAEKFQPYGVAMRSLTTVGPCLIATVMAVGSLSAAEPVDTPQLIKKLCSRYLDERKSASKTISKLPEEKRVALAPQLVELFHQEGVSAWFGQSSAAKLLTKMGPAVKDVAPKLRQAILMAITRRDLPLARTIFRTLEAVDPTGAEQADPGLKKLLSDEDTAVRAAAVSFIERTDSAKAFVPELLAVAGGTHTRAARLAVGLLVKAEAAADDVVPILVKATSCEEPLLALAAMRAVKKYEGDAEPAVPSLLEALKRDDIRIQRAAIDALGSIGPGARTAESILTELLKNTEPGFAEAAAKALAGIGPESKKTISALAAVVSKGGDLSKAAANALGSAGAAAEEALPVLEKTLKGKNKDQVTAAANALGKLSVSFESAFKLLLEMAKTNKGESAQAAVAAMRQAKETARAAIPDLVAAAKGTEKGLWEEIDRTLKEIKGENKAPSARNGEVTTEEGKSLKISLDASDPDDVHQILTAEIIAEPKSGELKKESGTTYAYRPKTGFIGTDSFKWKIRDNEAESDPAQVTIKVTPDQTSPKLESARSCGNKTEVIVLFDEPVTAKSGAQAANYKISPNVAVKKAKVSKDGRSVTLTTAALTPKIKYMVKAADIVDRAKAGNKGGGESTFTYIAELPGIRYEYYEMPPQGDTLKDFDKIRRWAKAKGVIEKFGLEKRKRKDRIAFRFDGLIRIPKDGEYTFFTSSDDGSRLYIGTKVVVNNDGYHGAVEKSGKIKLKAGKSPIIVTFYQGTGDLSLVARWSGPGIEKQEIPPSVLFHKPPKPKPKKTAKPKPKPKPKPTPKPKAPAKPKPKKDPGAKPDPKKKEGPAKKASKPATKKAK